MVDSCQLTKLDGGLQRLHTADKAAVDLLTSYGTYRSIRNITLHYTVPNIFKLCRKRTPTRYLASSVASTNLTSTPTLPELTTNPRRTSPFVRSERLTTSLSNTSDDDPPTLTTRRKNNFFEHNLGGRLVIRL